MPKLLFHPDVAHEIKSSFYWYQQQAEGLGIDFLNELEVSYQAIKEMPNTWPNFQNGFKRFLLSKFPYSVIYQINEQIIYIVAVMNNSRKPGYWQERV